jgi:CPA2 family monovalent cation:H+ antiporter-2
MTPDELRDIPFLDGVSEAGLERIAAHAGLLEAGAGQVLALPDDPGSGMFVILEGAVTVEVRGSSVELEAGTFFGELALLVPDAPRVARVRAARPVRCLSLPRADFDALLDTEPPLARRMLIEIARRLHVAES